MTSNDIKALIPSWVTDQVLTYVLSQFEASDGDLASFKKEMQNPKNWKRIGKNKLYEKEGYERCFDCYPYDDQLRLYVETDATDTTITNFYFSCE